MAGETIITVVGNLTADPELRYTQSGLAVANFTIASTPRTFDRASNDWKDGEALFLRASCWREFAEHVAGSSRTLLEAHDAAIMATAPGGSTLADALGANLARGPVLAANALDMAKSRFLLADQRSTFWGGLLPLAGREPSPPKPRRGRRRETIAR